MKQTAVEFLIDEILHIIPNDFLSKFEKAKEMEKQQMRDCFLAGDDAIFHGVSKNEIKSFEQYYNETFNK